MMRGVALFALLGAVGAIAGLGLVRAVEGSVRLPDAAAGWLVACAGAATARSINVRALRRARRTPLWGLAANGLRWLALLCMLAGYAWAVPAGFAAFGLTLAVSSLAFMVAEVAQVRGTESRLQPGEDHEHQCG